MQYRYWTLGTLLGCLLLLAIWPTGEVQSHYCDDNFSEQQDRENCWWRYWNGLTTDADQEAQATATPSSESATDGTSCDELFTEQQDRENCWWRYWNGLPLVPADNISPATATPEPGTTSGRAAKASGNSGDPTPTPTPKVELRVPGHDPVNVGVSEDGKVDMSALNKLEPDCDEATLIVHVDENGNVVIEVEECRSDS